MSNKRGAMFGIDARVTLTVAGFLALAGGFMGIKAYETIQAENTAADLKNIAIGLEALQNDLGVAFANTTILNGATCATEGTARCAYNILTLPTGRLNTSYTQRWRGPYIVPHPLPHPIYGNGSVTFNNLAETGVCTNTDPCYIWTSFAAVRLSSDAINRINTILDTASEGTPATMGRLRWVDNGNGTFTVRYAGTKGLSQ